jgi:hypothetical protein
MMSNEKTDIDKLLQSESDAIEANPDAPLTSETKVTRGHDRVKKLQIRLNEDEYRRVEEAAEARGIPASTMARSLILAALDQEVVGTLHPASPRVDFLSHSADAVRGRSGGILDLVSPYSTDSISRDKLNALLRELFSRVELNLRFISPGSPLNITYSAEAVSAAATSRSHKTSEPKS